MKVFQYWLLSSACWDGENEGGSGGSSGDGSGEGGEGSEGSNSGGEGEGGSGSGTPASLLDGLETDSRDWLKANGILKDGEEVKDSDVLTGLITKSRETEKLIGKSIRVPGDDASEEEVSKFRKALGVPEDAAGYEFRLPEDYPEEVPYNSDLAEKFKPVAHKLGLTAKQASGLHEFVAQYGVSNMGETAAAVEARGVAATTALEETWGPQDSDQYKANLEYADAGLRLLGGDAVMKELSDVGLIGPNKEIFAPALAKALAKAGRALGTEDDGRLTGDKGAVNNPYEDGGNLTEQMALVRKDPKKARQYMAAAGKKPGDFGLPESFGT